MSTSEPKPGDRLLDRYVPNATAEEREVARETFRQFALYLADLGERLEREGWSPPSRE